MGHSCGEECEEEGEEEGKGERVRLLLFGRMLRGCSFVLFCGSWVLFVWTLLLTDVLVASRPTMLLSLSSNT